MQETVTCIWWLLLLHGSVLMITTKILSKRLSHHPLLWHITTTPHYDSLLRLVTTTRYYNSLLWVVTTTRHYDSSLRLVTTTRHYDSLLWLFTMRYKKFNLTRQQCSDKCLPMSPHFTMICLQCLWPGISPNPEDQSAGTGAYVCVYMVALSTLVGHCRNLYLFICRYFKKQNHRTTS